MRRDFLPVELDEIKVNGEAVPSPNYSSFEREIHFFTVDDREGVETGGRESDDFGFTFTADLTISHDVCGLQL